MQAHRLCDLDGRRGGDPQGESEPFYADNIVYYTSVANNGYEGDLELANKLFDQNISDKTISVWYPKLIPGWYSQLRVVGGSSEHRYPIYVISKGRGLRA